MLHAGQCRYQQTTQRSVREKSSDNDGTYKLIDLKLKICSGENSHIKHTKYKLKLFDVKFKDLQWGNVTGSM